MRTVPIEGIREKATQYFRSSIHSLYNDGQYEGIASEAWIEGKIRRKDYPWAHRGGEGGIRTRENPSRLYTLSRRTCSTAPAPLHDDTKELRRRDNSS
jgi:hypothetical protein